MGDKSVDETDVARFSSLASEWWDPRGPFRPLHALNPIRLGFIRGEALKRFGRDPAARAPFAGLRLADVGCGGGLVTEPMARLGFAVTAVDPSAEAVDVARAHAGEAGLAIDYRDGGMAALAQEEGGFDVVLALEVAEHAPDPAVLLRACADLVAPGGLLVMSSLNRTLKSLALGKIAAEYLLRWVPAGTHSWRRFPTPAESAAALRAAGLEVAPPVGMVWRPLAGAWALAADVAVNYLMAAVRPPGAPAARRSAAARRSPGARKRRPATSEAR